ncbi:MAG: DUF6340 family protein [Bacteroidetes bacterium]|nr:DUF6340 family protein [Bacteroidota bacterium]
MLKRATIYTLLITLLMGCATATIQFQTMKPADVSLPASMKTIVILNRYRPTKQNMLGNIIEGLLTGEKPLQDRQGAENAITGLTNFITQSPRYKMVRASEELFGTGSSWFPEPLPQDQITALCKKYNADGLIILEAFDHDKITVTNIEERSRTENGQLIKYNVYISNSRINATAGWRVYEAKTAALIDEYRMPDSYAWTYEAKTKELSLAGLPDEYIMIRHVGYSAGQLYAGRVSPQWQTQSRQYYKKGNDALVNAKYKVRAGEWENAIAIWEKQLHDPKAKVRGRACYNIAVAYEQLNNMPMALQWAQRALSTYHFNPAEDLIHTLENRMQQDTKLRQQLNNKMVDSLQNVR